jgi:hypothetical protein
LIVHKKQFRTQEKKANDSSLRTALSTANNTPQLVTKSPCKISEDIAEYLIDNPQKLIELEQSEHEHFENLSAKKKAKYKKRRWSGHGYDHRVVRDLAYLLQGYYFAYGIEGKKINPSMKRLAKELGVSVRTLDKAKATLKDMDLITWVSGKKTWEPNTYILSDYLMTTPIKNPEEGYRHPPHIYHKLMVQEKTKRFKAFWTIIREHRLINIAHHLLRRSKIFAKKCGKTSFEEKNKEFFTTWTRSKFYSGALDPPNEGSDSYVEDTMRYNHAQLERMLDEAETKKLNELGVLLPPEFIEILDRFGYAGELDNAMLHQKKRLANDWNTNPIQVEKVLRHMQRKDLHNHKRKNFWGFFNHLMGEEKVGYHAMRVKEYRKSIDGKNTRLDAGIDTKYIVDSIRDKERRSGTKISNYLLEKLIRKPSEFARTALEAVDHRMKLFGTKDKKVESPFGLLNSVMKMPSVEAIRANFYYKKRAV